MLKINDSLNTIWDSFKKYEKEKADTICLEFDNNEISYKELGETIRIIANSLKKFDIYNKKVILMFPMGLEYIYSFFSVMCAGGIPVPSFPSNESPNFKDRLIHIANNAEAEFIFTFSQEKMEIDKLNDERISGMNTTWIFIDKLVYTKEKFEEERIPDYAFMQYSSGTTSIPKGVAITHKAVLEHLDYLDEVISSSNDNKEVVCVNWMPLYHDMGLISGMLLYITKGHRVHLIPTKAVMENPYIWLEKIAETHANITLAPNFAFEMCVSKIQEHQKENLDLSSLKLLINGAEQISVKTIDRFFKYYEQCGIRRSIMCPCYGMSEAIILVTRSDVNREPIIKYFNQSKLNIGIVEACDKDADNAVALVSCGRKIPSTDVICVDNEKSEIITDNRIGEIWITGSNVATEYYNNVELTEESFGAKIKKCNDKTYYKTGDLGFWYQECLFICGRIKEMIICNGKNINPTDIESYIISNYKTIGINKAVTFSIVSCGEEKIVCIIEKVEIDKDITDKDIIRKRNCIYQI